MMTIVELAPFLLLLLTLTTLVSASNPLRIPLVRRGRTSALDLGAEADKLRYKYGYSTSNELRTRNRIMGRASSSGISIINQGGNVIYLGSISIGTPSQSFNVILDTGSSDLWVAGTACQTCQTTTTLYDGSKSSSFKRASDLNAGITLLYGSGSVNGSISADTVTMGGFTIENQVFVTADSTSNGLIEGTTSGLIGLAFSTIANTHATPFWQALADGGELSSPEMSFWIARVSDADGPSDERPGGEFTLGGTNTSLFSGAIEFYDLAYKPTYWMLSVKGITMQGQSISISTDNDALAAIDTGTTLLGGPSADVAKVWAAIPGSAPWSDIPGYYTFPCTTSIEVTVSFGGKAWPIRAQDMNLGSTSSDDGNTCVGAIFDLTLGSKVVPGPGIPSWVVGDTFLKNVYSVFRSTPPSVGFAELSVAAGGTDTSAPITNNGSSPVSIGIKTKVAFAPFSLLISLSIFFLYL